MRINHNITALNTYRQLAANNESLAKTTEKLSSGLRINRAGDDAAGLAISEKMRGQIRGLDQAARNGQDGISLIQTAEGALNETHSILQRMRELAVQSASDTNSVSDRKNLQKEVDQLATEITRISNTTEFNKQNLLNGGVQTGKIGADNFQIGANAGQTVTLSIGAMDSQSLGVAGSTTTASGAGAGKISASGSTFDNSNLGAKVTNGAVITATYTAATAGTAAVAGDYTVTLSAAFANTKTITIDGQIFTSNTTPGTTNAATSVFASDTAGNQAAGLVAVINGNATLSAKYTATLSGVNVKLVQKAGQESSTAPATSTTDVATVGVTTTTAGAAAVAATSAKIALSDGGTGTDTINISNASATKFTTTNGGNFSGITFDLGSNLISSIATSASSDKLTITTTTTNSTAATFAGNAKTADAVAAAGIDVSSSATAASNAITTIDTAIDSVSSERAKLGSFQNRLEHTINNLSTASENLSSAESRIRDTDMAKTMMEQTKNNILAQAAQAMLAQANQQPQGVLQLLR